MKIRYISRKRISLILAILLLFVGVCFEIINADCFVEHFLKQDLAQLETNMLTDTRNNAYLYSSDTILSVENSTVIEDTNVQRISATVNKSVANNYRTVFLMLYVTWLFASVYRVFRTKNRLARWRCIKIRPFWDNMIWYIHLRDGENA